MRYLAKSNPSKILEEGWRYSIPSHRPKIREELLKEQYNFCAYTERYITPIDACDIEHFDERKKKNINGEDDYWNWYAVHHWINMHKRSITNFSPIMLPYDDTLPERIRYVDGEFRAIDEDDIEAHHLIEFLGWNNPKVAEYRAKVIARHREVHQLFFAGDDEKFIEYMKQDSENLSFITALEAELGLSFS
ncbi:MAG: hypothetical protein AAF639_30335 [Chloroflexota bacterium]